MVSETVCGCCGDGGQDGKSFPSDTGPGWMFLCYGCDRWCRSDLDRCLWFDHPERIRALRQRGRREAGRER